MQRLDVAPAVNTGVPTVGLMDTARLTIAEGPLHPLAVTRIFTEPEKPFAQVITPDELMLPADALLTDQLKPVLLLAVVE
jgi:hypothetical protein